MSSSFFYRRSTSSHFSSFREELVASHRSYRRDLRTSSSDAPFFSQRAGTLSFPEVTRPPLLEHSRYSGLFLFFFNQETVYPFLSLLFGPSPLLDRVHVGQSSIFSSPIVNPLSFINARLSSFSLIVGAPPFPDSETLTPFFFSAGWRPLRQGCLTLFSFF